jgi:thioesterase-3
MTKHRTEPPYQILIRESHLDTFGHVNNATYLSLMEEARWDVITKHGFGLKEIQQLGLGPIILEINLAFKKELRLRETVFIETTLTDVQGKIQTLRQRILNRQNEECTIATFKFGLFDTHQRKLIDPTPEWLNALGYRG